MHKKLALGLILLLLALSLGGCRGIKVKENDPDNMAQIPYTFVGESARWHVEVEVREVTEDDLGQLSANADPELYALYLNGYRTVLRLEYLGEQPLRDCTYTFADYSQWAFKNNIEMREDAESFTAALILENDLGGLFYGRDPQQLGGPVPPRDQEFTFRITARTAENKLLRDKITLVAE